MAKPPPSSLELVDNCVFSRFYRFDVESKGLETFIFFNISDGCSGPTLLTTKLSKEVIESFDWGESVSRNQYKSLQETDWNDATCYLEVSKTKISIVMYDERVELDLNTVRRLYYYIGLDLDEIRGLTLDDCRQLLAVKNS